MHAALCIMCMLRKAHRQSVGIIVRLGVVNIGSQISYYESPVGQNLKVSKSKKTQSNKRDHVHRN